MISCCALDQRERSCDNVSAFEANEAKKRGSTLVRRCWTRASVDSQRVCISFSSCSSLGREACFDQPPRSERMATCCATRTPISSTLKVFSFFIFLVKELKRSLSGKSFRQDDR